MKKIISILCKILLIIMVIFFVGLGFSFKTQYAILKGYIFERPLSGQMNIIIPHNEKKIVICDGKILADGVYTRYELSKKKWRTYDIDLLNKDGEISFSAIDFTTADIKFSSDINRVTVSGNPVDFGTNREGKSVVGNDEITSQAMLLFYTILVYTRYQSLYLELKLLLCILIPFMLTGCLLLLKPVFVGRFLDKKLSRPMQCSEYSIRALGAFICFVSLLLPFALLYV